MQAILIRYAVGAVAILGLIGWAMLERSGRREADTRAALASEQRDQAQAANKTLAVAMEDIKESRDRALAGVATAAESGRRYARDLVAIRMETADAKPIDPACPFDSLAAALAGLRHLQRPAAPSR